MRTRIRRWLGCIAWVAAVVAGPAVRAAATYWLPDYEYPEQAGNYRVYDGVQGRGAAWTTIGRIESTECPITSYMGRSPILPIQRLAVAVRLDQGNSTSVNYRVPGKLGWGYYGTDDQDDEVRFDPPVVVTNRVTIGQSIPFKTMVYSRGRNPRDRSATLQIVALEDLTAGGRRFAGCLHTRLTFTWSGASEVHDYWLAPAFGAVKFTHAVPGKLVVTNILREFNYVSRRACRGGGSFADQQPGFDGEAGDRGPGVGTLVGPVAEGRAGTVGRGPDRRFGHSDVVGVRHRIRRRGRVLVGVMKGTASDNFGLREIRVGGNGGSWKTATNTVQVTGIRDLLATYWPTNAGDRKTYNGTLGEASVGFSPSSFGTNPEYSMEW